MKTKNPLLIILNIFFLVAIFYASTSLTMEFFSSFGEGNVKISNLILAIVNDSCKTFLPFCIVVAIKKEKYLHSFILILVIIGTVSLSYLASQGTDLNLNNEILIETSNKSEIEAIKQELSTKLNDAKSEKQKELATYENEVNSLPSNYYSKKKELLSTMSVISSQHDSSIKTIEEQLKKVNEKLLSGDLGSSKTTKGYNELSNSLGITVDKIVKWKNIFLEVLAVVLSLNLGMLYQVKETTIEPKKKEIFKPGVKKFTSNLSNIKKKNSVSEIDLHKYFKKAVETSNEFGKCIGYKKIGDFAEVSNAYNVKNELIKKGFLETKKDGTYIKKHLKKGDNIAL